MSNLKWEVKEHYEKPSWGIGDYDEYYEVVNERGDALQATEYEGLEQIADALNGFEGNLRISTALEINQHCDNQMLKTENDYLKAENSKMRQALEVVANWRLPSTGKFWNDDKTDPMSYGACYGSSGERDYIKSIATEALKKDSIC